MMFRMKWQSIRLMIIWLFLFFGAFWHLVGRYEWALKIFAGPTLMIFGIWIAVEYIIISKRLIRLLLFSLLVFVVGFASELLGVATGFPFGDYHYGRVLWPVINGVPIAIGFAWVTMLFSSAAVANMIGLQSGKTFPAWAMAIMIGALMTIFDFIMEPAAIALGYWSWYGGVVPATNYAAWFAIGTALAYIGCKFRALPERCPPIGVHLYFAQLGYFVAIYFKP
jgi:putative membrane protein